MKSPEQRTRFGAWLRDVRKAAGYANAQDASEAMRGTVRIAVSALAELESGTKLPSDVQREGLERFFRSVSPRERDAAVAEPQSEVAALVSAIAELVAEMRQARAEQQARDEALARLAAGVEAALARSSTPA